MKRYLNVDFAKTISEFESALRKFVIKKEVYTRIFRGKGLEFDGYRDYAPDDDSSMIDWKATMRAGGKLLCKQYIEERDLKILFVVDVSDNMIFGSGEKLKCEKTAELVIALAHVFMTAGDRVGLFLSSDRVNKMVLPGRGKPHFEALVTQIVNPYFYGGIPRIKDTILFLLKTFPKIPDAIFLVSDFIRMRSNAREIISVLGMLSDVVALIIEDPVDYSMPDMSGEITIQDPYTGKQIIVNPQKIKEKYGKYALEQREIIKNVFDRSGVDYTFLRTDKTFINPIVSFLTTRLRKKKSILTK